MKLNRIGLGQGIVTASAVCLAISASSFAQTTTTPPTTTTPTLTVLNPLIDQFGGFFALGCTTGTGGITTTPTTTDTGTPTPPPTGDDMGTGPQPTIVGNQFTTTTGGALNARRPGLMIQRSFAIQSGSEMPDGNYVDEPNFAQSVFNEIGLNMIESISGLIQSLNLLGSVGDIFNPGGGTGGGGFPGAATTGGGTTTPIS